MPETLEWTLESFDYYDDMRKLFREASSDFVRKALQCYIGKNDRMLEIGSGLGEFLKLAPEYSERTLQTDASRLVVDEHRRKNFYSNISLANVYDLGFADASFDTVIGYSSFDCFLDLEKALGEMKRVLVPGGKLIHFLDLKASPNAIYRRFQKDFVPYPVENKLGVEIGLRLVPKDRVGELVRNSEWYGNIHETYIKDPELSCSWTNGFRDLRCLISHEAEKLFPEAGVIGYNEYFFNNFRRKLTRAGYSLLEFGIGQGSAVVARDDRYEKYLDCNAVQHYQLERVRCGNSKSFAERMSANQIMTISDMHVAVSQTAA